MEYEESLQKARKSIEFADHMVYITFPLVKENKLIIKILVEIEHSLKALISSILQYENYYKRISLYKNPALNLQTFIRLATKYSLTTEEISQIKEILLLAKKHEKAELEFTKSGKFIIMVNSSAFSISLEKIKSYLYTIKNILRKAESIITEKK